MRITSWRRGLGGVIVVDFVKKFPYWCESEQLGTRRNEQLVDLLGCCLVVPVQKC
jgi:hypothetical protein